ncbi:hypothetical protein ACXR2T_03055 [Leucobacter sp. HY1910]
MPMQLKREPKQATALAGGTPSVNLLPPSVLRARQQSRLIKQWGFRIVSALVIVAAGCLMLFGWQTVTALQLAQVQAQTDELISRVSAEADIQLTLKTEKDLESYRDEAMATQLKWQPVIDAMRATIPEGATLSAFQLASGAAPAGDSDAVGLTGTVDVSGNFVSPVGLLRAIGAIDSLTSVVLIGGAEDETTGLFVVTLEVTFDQTVYTSVEAEEKTDTDETAEAAESEEEVEEADAAESEASTDIAESEAPAPAAPAADAAANATGATTEEEQSNEN